MFLEKPNYQVEKSLQAYSSGGLVGEVQEREKLKNIYQMLTLTLFFLL